MGFYGEMILLYGDYKKHVGSFHWTPLEIFKQTFPEAKVSAEDLTVISWILPQTEATKADTRKEKEFPPERWARFPPLWRRGK